MGKTFLSGREHHRSWERGKTLQRSVGQRALGKAGFEQVMKEGPGSSRPKADVSEGTHIGLMETKARV
jgi:hypothetical protein